MPDEDRVPQGGDPRREDRCENCRFALDIKLRQKGIVVFECRRFPPAVNIFTQRQKAPPVVGITTGGEQISIQPISSFPRVGPNTWCGEWKPRA